MDSKNGFSCNNNMPPLCAGGCGFFGSAETNNLCSKCYEDYLRKHLLNTVTKNLARLKLEDLTKQIEAVDHNGKTSEPTGQTKQKIRCRSCNKKVGLLGFACRCGSTFCSVHRMPESHCCVFDYKSFGRQELAKNNVLVKGDKLQSRID